MRRLKFAGEDDDLSQETDEYVIEVIGIKNIWIQGWEHSFQEERQHPKELHSKQGLS